MKLPKVDIRDVLQAMQELRETDYHELAKHLGIDVEDMPPQEKNKALQKIRNKIKALRRQGYVAVCRIENGYEALGKPRMRKVVRIIDEE